MEDDAGDESTDVPGEELPGPEVRTVLDGDVARVTVAGELTEAARRPLVRELTELLLGGSPVRGVEVDLRDVSFMNSAGMAVLVQVQRMTAPRGIEVVLVEPSAVVARPLQLSGLWRRFAIRQDATDDDGDAAGS
jgi:anti-anti-sigma factor